LHIASAALRGEVRNGTVFALALQVGYSAASLSHEQNEGTDRSTQSRRQAPTRRPRLHNDMLAPLGEYFIVPFGFRQFMPHIIHLVRVFRECVENVLE